MPGQPGLLGPETPQDISFQSMIGLPEEVLSTTFSFLKDALESQEERDMSAGLARGVGTAPSQYARCLVALRAAGTLGATLDSLLRQWARFFQDYWTLAGEREVLALLVRSTVSNTEPAGRSDSGNKSKQASRSTAKGKAKTAPKDCVMALALLGGSLLFWYLFFLMTAFHSSIPLASFKQTLRYNKSRTSKSMSLFKSKKH